MQVIVFPRGQLTPKDREKLTKAGFCAVEADDPKSVVTVVPGAPLVSGDDLLLCAMNALTGDSTLTSQARELFAIQLGSSMRSAKKARDAAK